MPHSFSIPSYIHRGKDSGNFTFIWTEPVVSRQESYRAQVLLAYLQLFVQTTKLFSAKSVLDLMHGLLGVSHSW